MIFEFAETFGIEYPKFKQKGGEKKELPKEELLYISGRVDSYVAMENNKQKPA